MSLNALPGPHSCLNRRRWEGAKSHRINCPAYWKAECIEGRVCFTVKNLSQGGSDDFQGWV